CHNYGEEFLDCAKAEKRSNTLCIASFDNAGTGRKGKPECGIYFWTVPKHPSPRQGVADRLLYHCSALSSFRSSGMEHFNFITHDHNCQF
ncbi:MAG: hypothetical protein IJU29_01435, partial [Oscillospiraceae bacterium]|nr:hypothetical protein [Oscillospiraceae bacterium]